MVTKAIVITKPIRFIKNMKLPNCIDCVFHIPGSPKLGKCTKFGEKDIITGKILYNNVINTRYDENMCGVTGNYFEHK